QSGVEGGGLAAAGRAGADHHPVRRTHELGIPVVHIGGHAEIVESEQRALAVEKTEHRLLAPDRRRHVHADVKGAAVDVSGDLSVLRAPALDDVERRRPQDGQISADNDGRTLDVRVNMTPTIWGEKAVLRLLDRKRTLLTLDDLGMPTNVHDGYSKLVRSPYGMVICAGPTGCGKTTTLYATL